MRTYQQFINGKLVSPLGFAIIEVENPSTGEIMAQTPNGGKEDGLAALAQPTRRRLPGPRCRLLHGLGI